MQRVTGAIATALGAALAPDGPRFCVAVSGGLDSSVLVHAMAGLAPGRVRAIYVDHGLHPDAPAWGGEAGQLCTGLGVPFSTMAVAVATDAGQGLEAAARHARYRALAAALAPGEWLLTAHHRDDQAETLLLNLLRGAGPAGLAGIPARTTLGAGTLCRPLLDVPRRVLLDYARAAGLAWVEDPANTDTRLDRNLLRHRLLPLLAERWPAAAASIARSARLSGEAAVMLEALAEADARRVTRRGRVMIEPLRALPEPRQRNLLRFLCRRDPGAVPPEARLREGLAQMLGAGDDRLPLVAWPGGEMRRYRGVLYLLAPVAPLPATVPDLPVRAGARLDLGALGRLRLLRAQGRGLASGRLAGTLTVRWRQGGERLRPAGSTHARELKKLLQDRGIVPWMRDRIPLLYSDDRLVAVAGLWVADEVAARGSEPALRVSWDRHPALE
ncbi:MAG: tRNA lysidine(34) synthetase TilS [Gammaproteobacteria bacterium]|nr:tRNA lysidine(34) synthetase TilS [Gammaproteobacteria bacterium]